MPEYIELISHLAISIPGKTQMLKSLARDINSSLLHCGAFLLVNNNLNRQVKLSKS